MGDAPLDCLIVGGGPAGLTAAIYLARFHLNVSVVDSGRSRALWIPCTHNHAGFPDGISGADLVARMQAQAIRYGARMVQGTVTRVEQAGAGFLAEWGGGDVAARSLLMATGVTNRRLDMDPAEHEAAVHQGLIRYCPVCDGYEVTDRRVAVVGAGARGLAEAVFLRSFTADVTLYHPTGPHVLTSDAQARAEAFGIRLRDGPCRAQPGERTIALEAPGGSRTYDSIYPALGSDTHVELARQLGARIAEDGTLPVDTHQRTSIAGLYAAGDVVLGLDQISHAMGEGGVAATTIRNDLAEQAPLLRAPCAEAGQSTTP